MIEMWSTSVIALHDAFIFRSVYLAKICKMELRRKQQMHWSLSRLKYIYEIQRNAWNIEYISMFLMHSLFYMYICHLLCSRVNKCDSNWICVFLKLNWNQIYRWSTKINWHILIIIYGLWKTSFHYKIMMSIASRVCNWMLHLINL